MNVQDTSRAAWRSVQSKRKSDKARVFAHIAKKPSTCDEIEVALNMLHQSASSLIGDLRVNDKVICRIKLKDGTLLTRPTRTGRAAYVYRVRDTKGR